MFRVFITNNKLIVFDKTEKEFRQKYGNNFEQVTIVKEESNIDSVCEKLSRQYKAEVIKDYHIKKKLGWKYWSDDLKQQISTNISIALKRYKKTKEHVENMSKSRMGKAKFKGKKHSAHSKMLISFAKKGQDSIKGRKWMHNPYSGKEKRGYELEEGMIWGRSPEAADHILKARSLRGKR